MSTPFSDNNPPPPPPKQSSSSRRHHSTQQPTRSNTARNDPSHAHHTSRSADTTSRTRPARSQTAGPPATHTSSRPQPPQARRSHSSDSTPSDKSKLHRSKTKKTSIHADVIDHLDFTGVGPMFHHDGPFDACAPSRNRHRTKAPMYAWTSINAEDEEVAARYRDNDDTLNPVAPPLTYDNSYSSELPRSPPVAANYSTYYSEPPKKKVDAIAEAWGIHEPEPYEEFFAGGGDDDGPIGGYTVKESRSSGRRTRENSTSRPRGGNRIPPPQPIFSGDRPVPEGSLPQASPGSGGANLGRNKSIIQRIRRMRDSPNVPVGFDDRIDTRADGVPSPTPSTENGSHGRQAHRRTDSILGRFTRGGRGDTSPASPVEPFIYVDDRSKELPPTPTSPVNRYSDGPSSPGTGLGRTTSILKRVKGVVGRGRQ